MTVQELFKDRAAWVQESYALDEDGHQLLSIDVHQGVCFCLAGAVRRVYNSDESRITAMAKLAGVIRALYPAYRKHLLEEVTVIKWNDDLKRTIQDVRKVVRIAGV